MGEMMATLGSSEASGHILGPAQERLHRFRSIAASRRVQLAGALLSAALGPYLFELIIFPTIAAGRHDIAVAANAAAVIIAFWMRLSLDVYPGIRRTYVIVPSVLAGHGIVFAALLATRLPYGRTSLVLGIAMHIAWLYLIYFAVERRIRLRIAVVPGGAVHELTDVPDVDWLWLKRPRLHDAKMCKAIAADFSADLSDGWESFLAEAALTGRMVYQHKQLSESLTGRVSLGHLSENTFGSLLPSRGYFHVKSLIDFVFALAVVPIALPLMGIITLAILTEGTHSPIFRQKRIGRGGEEFTVYKFRTMRAHAVWDPIGAATTIEDDVRITKIGRFLRQHRLDELPQIFNILMWQMSWIGPRPEAYALSNWYKEEIPFYAYRHVVKPGISGWAQVNQGHVVSVEDVNRKLEFDFYYIKYFSPWLDLLILVRTLKTMATGFGSR